MATYFLRSSHVSRGKGSLATRAAAYRAGERIKDERTGVTYDYSDRRDIAYKEVVLPSDLAGRADMSWTQDRATLWNAMEYAGTRHNSRTAREWLVLVPPELTPQQRIALVRTFAAELSNKYRAAVDVAIHEPRPGADPRNHHAHLLMTNREVSPEGVGARTTLELGGRERHQRGLGPTRDDYLALRKLWADVTNDSLRRAGLNLRVDHRSLEQQGRNQTPRPPLPDKVFYAERKYGPSRAGVEIRARHREQLEASQKGELSAFKERLRERAVEQIKQKGIRPKQPRRNTLTKEQRNELRREKYAESRVTDRLDPIREARKREAARKQFHKYWEKDPEGYRQRRRQYRLENADEINRKQRLYRKTHADELNRARREYRASHAAEENRKQRDYRQRVALERETSKQPTAEESARKWLEYRESHGPGPTAEESARNWLAHREAQQLPDPAHSTASADHTHRNEPAAADDRDDRPRPTHDHDLEL